MEVTEDESKERLEKDISAARDRHRRRLEKIEALEGARSRRVSKEDLKDLVRQDWCAGSALNTMEKKYSLRKRTILEWVFQVSSGDKRFRRQLSVRAQNGIKNLLPKQFHRYPDFIREAAKYTLSEYLRQPQLGMLTALEIAIYLRTYSYDLGTDVYSRTSTLEKPALFNDGDKIGNFTIISSERTDSDLKYRMKHECGKEAEVAIPIRSLNVEEIELRRLCDKLEDSLNGAVKPILSSYPPTKKI